MYYTGPDFFQFDVIKLNQLFRKYQFDGKQHLTKESFDKVTSLVEDLLVNPLKKKNLEFFVKAKKIKIIMYRIFAIFLFVQTIPEAFTMPTYLDQHQSAEVRKVYHSNSKCANLYKYTFFRILLKKYFFPDMYVHICYLVKNLSIFVKSL